jgi:hypothetical protein
MLLAFEHVNKEEYENGKGIEYKGNNATVVHALSLKSLLHLPEVKVDDVVDISKVCYSDNFKIYF